MYRSFIKTYLLLSILFAIYHVSANSFAPPDGKTLVQIGQNKPCILDYINKTNVLPAGAMTYTTIHTLTGLEELLSWTHPETGETIDNRMDFHVWHTDYKNLTIQVGMWMCGHLANTLNGTYDNQIATLANHLKQANCPVYLRLGYEVNGRFPSTHYPDAYRYVYKKLKEEHGVKNTAFVWHVTPGYTVSGRHDHFDWYPGDEYVDWIAVSYFVDVVGGGGISDEDYQNTLKNLDSISSYAMHNNIPLMIAEAAPMKQFEVPLGQESWDKWFTKLFEYIEKYDVKALSYINQKWSWYGWQDHQWGDSRVWNNEVVNKKWFEEVSSDRYIHSSDTLFKMLNFPNSNTSINSRPYSNKSCQSSSISNIHCKTIHKNISLEIAYQLTSPRTINFEIYDLHGKKISTISKSGIVGKNRFVWTLNNKLANRVYLLNLSSIATDPVAGFKKTKLIRF